jgi:hypothetical protein
MDGWMDGGRKGGREAGREAGMHVGMWVCACVPCQMFTLCQQLANAEGWIKHTPC